MEALWSCSMEFLIYIGESISSLDIGKIRTERGSNEERLLTGTEKKIEITYIVTETNSESKPLHHDIFNHLSY